MRADTTEEFILSLQKDYDRWMVRYKCRGSSTYLAPVVAKLLRDDLRAILHLRKQGCPALNL